MQPELVVNNNLFVAVQAIARPMYSNPPLHGALLVSQILKDNQLKQQWYKVSMLCLSLIKLCSIPIRPCCDPRVGSLPSIICLSPVPDQQSDGTVQHSAHCAHSSHAKHVLLVSCRPAAAIEDAVVGPHTTVLWCHDGITKHRGLWCHSSSDCACRTNLHHFQLPSLCATYQGLKVLVC